MMSLPTPDVMNKLADEYQQFRKMKQGLGCGNPLGHTGNIPVFCGSMAAFCRTCRAIRTQKGLP